MKSTIYGAAIKVPPGQDGLRTMAAGVWLNDQIINFHVECLNIGAERVAGSDVVFLDTHFFKQHLDKAPDVKRADIARQYGVLKVSLYEQALTSLIFPKDASSRPWPPLQAHSLSFQ